MSIPQEVHRARVKLMPCYTRPTKEGLQSIISLIGYVDVGMVKNILVRFSSHCPAGREEPFTVHATAN